MQILSITHLHNYVCTFTYIIMTGADLKSKGTTSSKIGLLHKEGVFCSPPEAIDTKVF